MQNKRCMQCSGFGREFNNKKKRLLNVKSTPLYTIKKPRKKMRGGKRLSLFLSAYTLSVCGQIS